MPYGPQGSISINIKINSNRKNCTHMYIYIYIFSVYSIVYTNTFKTETILYHIPNAFHKGEKFTMHKNKNLGYTFNSKYILLTLKIIFCFLL